MKKADVCGIHQLKGQQNCIKRDASFSLMTQYQFLFATDRLFMHYI